jgi:hypothetical protein
MRFALKVRAITGWPEILLASPCNCPKHKTALGALLMPINNDLAQILNFGRLGLLESYQK